MSRTIVYERPWLYPKQQEAIFAPQRYAVIEASTKAGKTVGCIVWLTEQAIQGRDGWNYWWVAPTYSTAKMAYRRLKRAMPRDLYTSNDSELFCTLANGARVWFKGSDRPDSLYGEDVYAAVIDEATRCKEEAWHALRTTLSATNGPVRIIGNVKGRKNWAYRLARKAEAGKEGMAYAKLTAHDAIEGGVLTEEEVEDARAVLPEAVFRELYLAEASDDEGNPFGVTAIRACVTEAMSEADPYVWGWDLAKSEDWTVGIALDETQQVCGFVRYQKPWRDTIRNIREVTGKVPALVDSTGVGDPVLEELQADGGKNFEGFKFTSPSKQQIMEGLAVGVQKGDLGFPDGPIVRELETFEYEYTRTGVRYSAPEGLHDDCVCALALAREKWVRRKRGGVKVRVYYAGMEEDAA